MRSWTAAAALVFALSALAQQPRTPAFDRAQVFVSPPNSILQMRAGYVRGRYELREATLLDLIRTAWNVDADDVIGGPDWLDEDRFDVLAAAPVNSTPETRRAMLQNLLRDRFQLSVHNSTRQAPAYEIVAGKKPNLKPAEPSQRTGCVRAPGAKPPPPQGTPQPPITFVCQNMTMDAFAKALAGMRETSGYLLDHPVLNRSGIAGAWDFSFTWSPRNVFLPAPPTPEVVSLFDAFDKQLGLKLSLTKVATPVIAVDKASHPPVDERKLARQVFEVADIRPDGPDARGGCSNVGVQTGGTVRIQMTLRGLILETQGEAFTHRIASASTADDKAIEKALDGPCWTVLAKAPVQEDAPAGWSGPVWNGVDIGTMRQMLRSLLEDRFGLQAHTEDRPVAGFALVAGKPKLHAADPGNRPGCREGPGADGKDPRIGNPLLSRLVTCRNMSLARFVEEMNHSSFGPGGPVIDATGISGRYDLTINFSAPSAFASATQPRSDGAAADPNGALSFAEALSSQLGLKLQARQVPAPVLVVDRVNATPGAN